MPELPEVETVRRVIEPQISGHCIESITVNHPSVIAHPSIEEFSKRIAGEAFAGSGRRGKFLILHLSSGGDLVIHLRMTGCVLITGEDYPMEKHTHVILHLSDGINLRFIDTRRFGRFWLIGKGERDTFTGMDKLGLEPFDPALTGEYLFHSLGRRRKAIKECLLDQSVIAGVGNIYGDEILFAAGINPQRPADTLAEMEWNALAATIPERLSFFIEKNAITPEEYLRTKGQDYRNTPFLQVYGHGGEPCPVCGEILSRTVIAGRGSVYCPSCQKR